MPNELNENQTKLVALCKATGSLPFTTLWGQDTKDAQALVRAGILKRARHAYVLAPPMVRVTECVRIPDPERGIRGEDFMVVSIDEPEPPRSYADPAQKLNPSLLTQDDYDAIKAYVDNGHALHPNYAADLLHTLEELWSAADSYSYDGRSVLLSEVLFTSEGLPRLKLALPLARRS